VKDAIGPKGSVSIVVAETGGPAIRSADMSTHTRTNCIVHHHAALDANGNPAQADELISSSQEPSHDNLCEREQSFLLKAIDEDLDLTDHMRDAVESLRIVLAADQSIRTGRVVEL
jgi:hypothetical protein